MATLSGSTSFSFSGLLHGGVLAWLVLSAPGDPEPRQSMYEQVIQPHENRIIWYHLKDRLPDISPAATADRNRKPRVNTKFPQSIVSGPKDDALPPQRIWMPAPEVPAPKPAPLPNVLAVSPKAPARRFIPPPVVAPAARVSPTIPEAPAAPLVTPRATLSLDAATRRAPPKEWTPPAPAPIKRADPIIPEAPAAPLPTQQATLSLDAASRRAPTKQWTPPAPALVKRADTTISEAPDALLATQQATLALDPASRRAPPKQFAPPPPAPATSPTALTDAPDVSQSADRLTDASLAIVGLHPAEAPEFTPPAGSREAGFSAGPEIHRDGGAQTNQPANLIIPGLLARGGLKDSQPTLMAGVLPMPKRDVMAAIRAVTESAAPTLETHALRVSNAPDPRFEGRSVYSIAIQMPNITSYYGSWLVWFAERDRATTAGGVVVRPPAPTRKVDPKYIAAAASERVEGVVRLFATIRKDGSIDSVVLIRHLDDRLDRSAAEALAKWHFEPALRNGIPIDVDAIFEIPFRLAPRTAK